MVLTFGHFVAYDSLNQQVEPQLPGTIYRNCNGDERETGLSGTRDNLKIHSKIFFKFFKIDTRLLS